MGYDGSELSIQECHTFRKEHLLQPLFLIKVLLQLELRGIENFVTEIFKEIGKEYRDDAASVEIDSHLVVHYFSEGKFLAGVIKGNTLPIKAPDTTNSEDNGT